MNSEAKPSLLIYIPSYNRFDRLIKQIDRIEPFIDGERCSLVISDNCSTDQRYFTLDRHVNPTKTHIQRNPVNLGASVNVVKGFVEASTFDFLWIISDDDMLDQNAVLHVTTEGYLSGDIDLVYLQLGSLTTEKTEVLDVEGVLEVLNNGLGLVGCVIYRSSVVLPYTRVGFDYVSSSFPHLAILFSALADRGSLRVRSLPAAWFFSGELPAKPEETIGYIPGLYGFVRLADFIAEPRLRRKLLQGWLWGMGGWASEESRRHPVAYKSCLSYLLTQSPDIGLMLLLGGKLGPWVRPLGRMIRPYFRRLGGW